MLFNVTSTGLHHMAEHCLGKKNLHKSHTIRASTICHINNIHLHMQYKHSTDYERNNN